MCSAFFPVTISMLFVLYYNVIFPTVTWDPNLEKKIIL